MVTNFYMNCRDYNRVELFQIDRYIFVYSIDTLFVHSWAVLLGPSTVHIYGNNIVSKTIVESNRGSRNEKYINKTTRRHSRKNLRCSFVLNMMRVIREA